jgi:hypothetical protein
MSRSLRANRSDKAKNVYKLSVAEEMIADASSRRRDTTGRVFADGRYFDVIADSDASKYASLKAAASSSGAL